MNKHPEAKQLSASRSRPSAKQVSDHWQTPRLLTKHLFWVESHALELDPTPSPVVSSNSHKSGLRRSQSRSSWQAVAVVFHTQLSWKGNKKMEGQRKQPFKLRIPKTCTKEKKKHTHTHTHKRVQVRTCSRNAKHSAAEPEWLVHADTCSEAPLVGSIRATATPAATALSCMEVRMQVLALL